MLITIRNFLYLSTTTKQKNQMLITMLEKHSSSWNKNILITIQKVNNRVTTH